MANEGHTSAGAGVKLLLIAGASAIVICAACITICWWPGPAPEMPKPNGTGGTLRTPVPQIDSPTMKPERLGPLPAGTLRVQAGTLEAHGFVRTPNDNPDRTAYERASMPTKELWEVLGRRYHARELPTVPCQPDGQPIYELPLADGVCLIRPFTSVVEGHIVPGDIDREQTLVRVTIITDLPSVPPQTDSGVR